MTITAELIDLFESGHDMYANEGERPALTPTERAAIDRYNQTIDGYDDCFPLTKESLTDHMTDAGLPSTLRMIAEHFQMLETWREAIDKLYVDLRTGGRPDPGPHNTCLRLIESQGHKLTSMVTVTREAVCLALAGTAGPATADDGRVVVACM